MKILNLNIWGGKRWEDLEPFLVRQSVDTDLFCFQEVTFSEQHVELGEIGMAGNPRFSNLFQMLQVTLDGYTGYFGRELRNMPVSGTPMHYGSGVFVRKGLAHEYHEAFAYGAEEDRSEKKKAFDLSSRIVQTVVMDSRLAVHHLHGVWVQNDKGDNPGRFEQSHKLNQIMGGYSVPQILCGDFNLKPDSKSFEMLAEGRRDLIEEYGIRTTRPHYSPESGMGFCDYAIATPDLKVTDFQVLPDVVSDHLALVMEVN